MLQDEENNQLKTQLQKQREEERLTQEYLRQYGGDVNTTPIQQQDESLMTCQLCNKLVAMDELEFMDVRSAIHK
jgi:hypothetical protein